MPKQENKMAKRLFNKLTEDGVGISGTVTTLFKHIE